MRRKKRAELAAMETDALTTLLRSEMDKRPLDDALLREILAILRQRESEMPPVELTEEELAVWGEIETQCAQQKECAKQERSAARRKQIIGLGTVAACLIVLLVALPPVFGANSIIDLTRQIANGILTLFSPDDVGKGYVFQTDNPGLQELYDTVTELGITAPVVPMWLPKGFVLDEIKVDRLPSKIKVSATFSKDGEVVILNLNLMGSNVPHAFESDYPNASPAELEGITYYIASNIDNTTIIWEAENVSCSLFTGINSKDYYTILRSIKRKVVIP